MTVIHTVVAAQTAWYVWVADVIIVALISVFSSIASLRAVMAAFFSAIIFQPNALLQILCCALLAAVSYTVSRPILNLKKV